MSRYNRGSINEVQNGVDLINNFIIQSNFHFDKHTKHQYLTGITILILTCRIFDTILHIDY